MVVGFHIDAEVLEDVPEDNCSFLMERGMKIFAAGVIRFYHIEVCWFNLQLVFNDSLSKTLLFITSICLLSFPMLYGNSLAAYAMM